MELTPRGLTAVKDDEIRPACVFTPKADVDKAGNLYRQTGFFETFARGGGSGVFTRIDKTRRERPQPFKRIVGALDEQNPPLPFDQHRGSYLGIGKVDPAAGRADRALPSKLEFNPDRSATARAKLDEFGTHGKDG